MFNNFAVKCGLFGGVFASLSLLLHYGWVKLTSAANKSPPQLYGLPFIGSLHILLILRENFYLKLLPKDGELVKYKVRFLHFYQINDIKLAKHIFSKALNREATRSSVFKKYGFEPTMQLVSENERWVYRRQIYSTNKILKDIFVKQ